MLLTCSTAKTTSASRMGYLIAKHRAAAVECAYAFPRRTISAICSSASPPRTPTSVDVTDRHHQHILLAFTSAHAMLTRAIHGSTTQVGVGWSCLRRINASCNAECVSLVHKTDGPHLHRASFSTRNSRPVYRKKQHAFDRHRSISNAIVFGL